MTVEFRYAAFDEYARISRFVNDYWAKDHVYVRRPQLFEWTFGRSGLWDRDGYSFALAEDRGEVVGILGGIPFTFNRFGKASRGMWLANYMMRPDHRRGPVGIRLLNMLTGPPYEAVVAFGVVPSAVPLYRLLRWRILETIPRHIIVLPQAEERMACLLRLARPDWTMDRAAALARFFCIQEGPAIMSTRSMGSGLKAPPAEWDQKDWAIISRQTVGAARDLDYLTWRYMRHPLFDYRFICIPEGARTGLLVWRLETIRQATPEGMTELDCFGRLVEFLPVSSANARELLAAFRQELSDMQAMGADYYGYHGKTRQYLEENGFRSVDRHPEGWSVPARFQPLDHRGGGIISAVLIEDDTAVPSSDVESSWYWTKSDADQDRPN
jgi:hypothetical protein